MIFVMMSSAYNRSLVLQLAWQTSVQPHLCKTECWAKLSLNYH